MLQCVLKYKELEQKIIDLKEISTIVKQMNKNDSILPKINNKIRSLIFEQAKMLK